MGDSDSKLNKQVFEFINNTWRGYDEESVLRCDFGPSDDHRAGGCSED